MTEHEEHAHGELHVEAHAVAPLSLSGLNFAELKTEVDAALSALITGLGVAVRLSAFFPTTKLSTELTDAIQILHTIQGVIDKVL